MTTTPIPPRHFRRDITNALISVGIVIAVFVLAPTLGGAIAEAVLNR